MRGLKIAVTVVLVLLISATIIFCDEPAYNVEDSRHVYIVGVGDILTVRLREGVTLKEYDTTVMSSGKIAISFMEVEAAGLTVDDIRENAHTELSKYLRDFSVDLILKECRGKKIFVLGEVKRPGVYDFTAGLTLLQILAHAGGYTDTAVLRDMGIIQGELDNPTLIRVNIKGTVKGKEIKDVLLAQNDIIFIPRSHIGNWNAFIQKIRPSIEVLSIPVHGGATVKTLAE